MTKELVKVLFRKGEPCLFICKDRAYEVPYEDARFVVSKINKIIMEEYNKNVFFSHNEATLYITITVTTPNGFLEAKLGRDIKQILEKYFTKQLEPLDKYL
jgi:hypothetical protein